MVHYIHHRKILFQELSKAVSQAMNKYDNILVAGDLNIDESGSKGLHDNHFSKNLVKNPTCFKKTREGNLIRCVIHK